MEIEIQMEIQIHNYTSFSLPAWKEEAHEFTSSSAHPGDRVSQPGMGLQPVQLGSGRHVDSPVQVFYCHNGFILASHGVPPEHQT